MIRICAPRMALLLNLLVVAAFAASCGGSSSAGFEEHGIIVSTVEPAATAAVVRVDVIPEGGKPAAPAATATPSTQTTQQLAQQPTPTSVPATTPAASAAGPGRPASGRWIDVDVTRYRVQLMDGERAMQTIEPVAVGVQVNTGAYESTQTGLFRVHVKTETLSYDAPYKTYISHWIGYDLERDNGFHSFLKDATGKVVDASTGRISNGCVRTGAAEAIFAFAEIGMPVFIHF